MLSKPTTLSAVGHADAAGRQPQQDSDGEQVVVGDDRGGRVGQGRLAADVPALDRRWEGSDPSRGHPVSLGGRTDAGPAAGPQPGLRWAGQEKHLAMAQRREVLDDLPRPRLLVGAHAGDAGGLSVDEDDRAQTGGLDDALVAHPARHDEEPVDRPGELLDDPPLGPARLLRAPDDEDVAGRRRLAFGAPDHAGEVRVGDVGKDEGQGPGAAAAEGSRDRAGPVAKTVRDLEDVLAGDRVDPVRTRDGPRHRGRGDARRRAPRR